MKRFALFVALAAVAGPARAQDARFELGQRLRAFEAAWDTRTDAAARKRAVAPLKQASAGFFSFRLDQAGKALDEARFSLTKDLPPEPAVRWAASLSPKPADRLAEVNAELPVSLAPFYPVEADPPPAAKLRLTLFPLGSDRSAAAPASSEIAKLPHETRLSLKDLPEGDYTLNAEVLSGDKALAVSEQTLSVVKHLDERLERLQKAADALETPLTTDKRTVKQLAELLASLRKRAPETNYPAARLLAEAEAALASARAGKPHYGPTKPGQFWLNLATPTAAVPARVFVPDEAKGEKPLPLVVALHGAGGSENLFFDGYGRGAAARRCKERGWLLVSPRSPLGGLDVAEVVDEASRLYPVDGKRVFLVGHSMGAAQAVRAAALAPERYAGVAALGGGGGVRASDALKRLPFFVGVGTEDFALDAARGLHSALEKAEVKSVRYKEYEDVEHLVIVQRALNEVFAFFDEAAKS